MSKFSYLNLWIIGLALLTVSCGSVIDLKQELRVEMFGKHESVGTVAGNADPRFQTYTLTSVILQPSTDVIGQDTTPVVLFADAETEVKIVNRPQLIYKADLKPYKGIYFESAKVTFKKRITVGGFYSDAYTTDLVSGIGAELETSEDVASFSASNEVTAFRGQSILLSIGVAWKNTITRDDELLTDTVEPPTLKLSLSEE